MEFGFDDYKQTVGLRFQSVGVPPSSVVLRSWLQLTADEVRNETSKFTICAEAVGDARPFSSTSRNISGRQPTNNCVLWSQVRPWSENDIEKSPDISAVIQEVLDGAGWKKDAALVLLISGEGKRTSRSFDGSKDEAALLHIEFMQYQSYDKKMEEKIDGVIEYALSGFTASMHSSSLLAIGSILEQVQFDLFLELRRFLKFQSAGCSIWAAISGHTS